MSEDNSFGNINKEKVIELWNQKYHDLFLQGKKEKILIHSGDTEDKLDIFASKIGYKIFWPKDEDWPYGGNVFPYIPLIQINLKDLPNISTNPLPNTGLLQFFICGDGSNEEALIKYWSENDLKEECIEDYNFLEDEDESIYTYGDDYYIGFREFNIDNIPLTFSISESYPYLSSQNNGEKLYENFLIELGVDKTNLSNIYKLDKVIYELMGVDHRRNNNGTAHLFGHANAIQNPPCNIGDILLLEFVMPNSWRIYFSTSVEELNSLNFQNMKFENQCD